MDCSIPDCPIFQNFKSYRQADCKPNSVADSCEPAGNHSSRPQVSLRLEQPTRKLRRAAADTLLLRLRPFGLAPSGPRFPIWPCSVWGLPSRSVTGSLVRSYRTVSPLPLAVIGRAYNCQRRFLFCGTFRPLRALELRGTLPCGVRTFLGAPLGTPRLPVRLPTYDFMPFSNFCNSDGSSEWNSMGFPLIGCSNFKSAACRK